MRKRIMVDQPLQIQRPQESSTDKTRLYEIPYDTSDPAKRILPDREDTVTLEKGVDQNLDYREKPRTTRQEMYVEKTGGVYLQASFLKGQRRQIMPIDPVPQRTKCCSFSREVSSSQPRVRRIFFSLSLKEYYNPTHGQADGKPTMIKHRMHPFLNEADLINLFVHGYKKLDQPLEQVHGNHPCQFKQDDSCHRSEMCMFALHNELHQFDRTKKSGNSRQTNWQADNNTIVAKGYAQEGGIDFEESFASVVAWKSRIFERGYVAQRKGSLIEHPEKKSTLLRKAFMDYASSKIAWPISFRKFWEKNDNMDNCHSIGTPLATKPKLDVDLSGEPVDQSDYRSKIGSLMYLTSSRPDLVQAVCYCARYQARPTQKHLKEVKRIFKYLKGTINMGLWYPKDSGFELTAFLDADHAGCIDTRKSTSGGIQFLGDKLVSWMSKKQNCTAMSLAEAEYVALSASCAQVMWMRTQLQDYGFNYNKIPLYCDSQSAIAISCNPVQHSRTKHIHTRYHFIKEQVENGIIELYFVRTEYQLADMFTKALPEDRFKYLVRRIGMRCLTPADLEVLTNETA
ncbi:hypothetical protein Tco_0419370 [Tanacetum coccineum]